MCLLGASTISRSCRQTGRGVGCVGEKTRYARYPTPVLVGMPKTAETTGNNRHRDHRVTIPTGRVFSRTGHDRTNRVPLGEKVGGAMERTELRVGREVAHGFPRFLADPTAIHHGTVTRSRDTLCTNNQPRSSKTSFTGSAKCYVLFLYSYYFPTKGTFLKHIMQKPHI